MKFFRKLLAAAVACAMTMTVFSGMTAFAAATEPGETFTLNDTVATIHGRYAVENHKGESSYVFTHGSAGITVNFTGTEFWVKVPEVPTWANGEGVEVPHAGNLAVIVDSDMAMDATMIPVKEAGWLCLASGLTDGEHTIEVRKQSRGFYGIMASEWIAISQIGVSDGGAILTPDPLSDLVVEVYGDSISNGDAVWRNEDGSNSAYTFGNWTGVIERLLDAEVRVTGNTGNGLKGWVMGTKNGNVDNLLPPQDNWNKVDPNHGGGTWSHEGDNAADVVIINLGTNDRTELGNGDLTRKAFSEEYVRFIKQIKTDCPDAIVICTIGAMGGVSEWADTIGGAGFDYVEYRWQDGTYTKGEGDNAEIIPIYRDIAEGSMIDNLLGAGIAMTGTGFDSGIELLNADMKAEYINDASNTTGWQPKNMGDMGENCYVGIEFDEAIAMKGVTLTWEKDTRATASTSGYRVEVSADGETWTTPSGISYAYGENEDTVTFDETDIKAVRVVVLDSVSDKYAAKLFEMGVTSDEKVGGVISEDDIIHVPSVIDICNDWADETFCYFVEIQKCDTIDGGAGWDNGHPSNVAGEVYGLQFSTLINKVLGLGVDLPDDIPASAYELKTGKPAPEGNVMEAITGKTDTLSYIDEVIERAENGSGTVTPPPAEPTLGDVNGDGVINSTDFMQVRRHFLKLYTIPEDKQAYADVNRDGAINSTDFMQIRRHFLGLFTIK